MTLDTAIEILVEMRTAAGGLQAKALALAISALEDARDRREAEIDKAEGMLRHLLDGSEGRDREATWRYLRGKLTLPEDILDEVERRLGLACEGARE